MKKIIIQKEVSITQKEVDKAIALYEKSPSNVELCFGGFSGDKTVIIREIKKLSDVGKDILLLQYKYKIWGQKYKIWKKRYQKKK